MTVEEYNHQLNSFLKFIETNNIPFERAVNSSVQEIANRIFVDGRDSDGRLIGFYDKKTPLYVNPNNSPKGFAPEGKPQKIGVYKSGKKKGQDKTKRNKEKLVGNTFGEEGRSLKPHTTRWFPSYEAFRKEIGRPFSSVNLVLSGDLQSDFRKAAIGSPAKATKIDNLKYAIQLDREINEKKMEGHEKKYGKITDPTKEEEENFIDIGNKELINAMDKYGLL